MKKAILTACILAIPLSGCSTNAKTFWREMIRLSCRSFKKCEEDLFDDQYDSIKDCKDEFKDLCSPQDFADICEDYDRSAGADCLKQAREDKRDCPDPEDSDQGDNACDYADICGDIDMTALMECFGVDSYAAKTMGIPEAFETPEDEEDE
jgi:hypothetical protein